jgi:RNA polymerase-binding transcription factor DksA
MSWLVRCLLYYLLEARPARLEIFEFEWCEDAEVQIDWPRVDNDPYARMIIRVGYYDYQR